MGTKKQTKQEPEQASEKVLSRRVTKGLSVRLTDAEVLQYGRDVARAYADRERIEAGLDSIKAEYKGKIAEQDAIISKLSPCIHSGTQTRDVECEEVKNWTKVTVTVRRLDTGETIESRPMREDEKQMEMRVDATPKPGAPEEEHERTPAPMVSEDEEEDEDKDGIEDDEDDEL